jgi:hypothetical protein
LPVLHPDAAGIDVGAIVYRKFCEKNAKEITELSVESPEAAAKLAKALRQ